MKKITSLIASALLLLGLSANAQITSPVISTGKLMTAEELNASTGAKRIALQLVHSTDYGFWFVSNQPGVADTHGCSAVFVDGAVFEWVETSTGIHSLKKVSTGTFLGKTNANTLVSEDPQLFKVVQPGSGAKDADADFGSCREENRDKFCRFVKEAGGSWLNANGIQYNGGTGVWTMFYVYDLTNHVDGQVKFSAIEGGAVTGLEAGSKLATFSSPVATKIPAGVRAFHVEAAAAGDPVAKLKEITGNIPANQGVILVSKKDVEVMTAAEGTVAALPASALKGSSNRYTKDPIQGYVLATKDGVTQFYKTSGKLAPNKAYLELAAAAGTVALHFPGDATAIEGVEAEEEANAPVYDLSGRKVNSTAKGGIYIQNGKKFIVK